MCAISRVLPSATQQHPKRFHTETQLNKGFVIQVRLGFETESAISEMLEVVCPT
jgi:hypothetical protein